MDPTTLFFVPLIVFMIFVAPIWVIMHYRTKARKSAGFTEADYQLIQRLETHVKTMEARIQNLEKILDAEVPEWRQHYER